MFKLIFVNLVFALLLLVMLLQQMSNNWLWLGFIALWCIAEAWLSKDQRIKWWQWLLLFASLACLDLAILYFFA